MTDRRIPPRVDQPSPPPPAEPDRPPIAEGLVIRPGDTLVVRVHPDTSPEQADTMRDQLAQWLPGAEVRVVFVLAEQMAVYRQEDDRA